MSTQKNTQVMADAQGVLRDFLKPGQTIYTTMSYKSASGYNRSYKVFVTEGDRIRDISSTVARATGLKFDCNYGGVKVGMDSAFGLVYYMAAVIYPNGIECTGENCCSNDHFNGDSNYDPHHHKDGGYTFRHENL